MIFLMDLSYFHLDLNAITPSILPIVSIHSKHTLHLRTLCMMLLLWVSVLPPVHQLRVEGYHASRIFTYIPQCIQYSLTSTLHSMRYKYRALLSCARTHASSGICESCTACTAAQRIEQSTWWRTVA